MSRTVGPARGGTGRTPAVRTPAQKTEYPPRDMALENEILYGANGEPGALKLAEWIGYEERTAGPQAAKTKGSTLWWNETKLSQLFANERYVEYFRTHDPRVAAQIAKRIEDTRRAQHTRGKAPEKKASVQAMALPTATEKQATELGKELGYELAKGSLKDKTERAIQLEKQVAELKAGHATDTVLGEQFDEIVGQAKTSGRARWNKAYESAQKLHGAKGVVYSDKEVFYQTLEGKTKEELTAYADAFLWCYGTSLESWIKASLWDARQERALALLRSDKVAARVAQVKEADGRLSTDAKALVKAADDLNPEELSRFNAEIEKYIREKYGRSVDNYFAHTSLTNDEFYAFRAAHRGDMSGALGHQLHEAKLSLWGEDDAVNTFLEENRKRLAQVKDGYARKIHGSSDLTSAERDVGRDLGNGDGKQRAVENLREHFDRADAYRLKQALDNFWGIKSKEVQKILEDRADADPADEKERRRRLEIAWDEITGHQPGNGALRSRIAAIGNEEERNETFALLEDGTLSRTMRTRRAVRGWAGVRTRTSCGRPMPA